jgi:hypothetical protein
MGGSSHTRTARPGSFIQFPSQSYSRTKFLIVRYVPPPELIPLPRAPHCPNHTQSSPTLESNLLQPNNRLAPHLHYLFPPKGVFANDEVYVWNHSVHHLDIGINGFTGGGVGMVLSWEVNEGQGEEGNSENIGDSESL